MFYCIFVIIGTIIEMIIPEGNNKKYVKTVIGIYIMFSIVSPIITRFTNKQVSFSIDNYDTYYKQTNTYDELSKQFENSNELKLEELYIENLKKYCKRVVYVPYFASAYGIEKHFCLLPYLQQSI